MSIAITPMSRGSQGSGFLDDPSTAPSKSKKRMPSIQEDEEDQYGRDGAASYERDIKKWKRAYERKKDKLDDAMKNLAEGEVKMQLLVDKLREKDNDLKSTRKDLREKILENKKAKQELANLTFEKMDLEKQLESGISGLNQGPTIQIQAGPGLNVKKNEQYLRQKQLRELEEQRKQLLQGVDLIEQQSLDAQFYKRKGQCAYCCGKIWKFFQVFIPLKNDIKFIKNRYDNAISSFFEFYRFLFTSSIVAALVFLYLIIMHIIQFNGSYSSTLNSIYPTLTLFSSFTPDVLDASGSVTSQNESVDYVVILLVFCFVLFFYSMQKWVRFDKGVRLAQMRGEQSSVFTSMLVGGWDWTVKTPAEADELRQSLQNSIKTSLEYDAMRANIRDRSRAQKCKRCWCRVCTMSFSLIILGGGGTIIILSYMYRQEIAQAFENISVLSTVANFISPLVLSVVNIIVPTVIVIISKREMWDFQSTLVKQQVWRLYIASTVNVVILILINGEFLLNNPIFRSTTLLSEQKNNDGTAVYTYRQNQIALTFFQNVFVQFFVNIILILVKPLIKRCLAACRKKKEWKPEFNVAEEVVRTLFFQMLLWMAMLMYPFITIVAPILQFIQFKFVLLKLRRFTIKPLKASLGNTGSYIMLFYVFSMAIATLTYAFFMTVNITFSTGPFSTYGYAMSPLKRKFNERSFSAFIYNLLSYTPLMWCLVGFLIATIVFRSNHLSIMRRYFRSKLTDQKKQQETLNGTITRLKKQLNFNKS